jgi:hypothetical protein
MTPIPWSCSQRSFMDALVTMDTVKHVHSTGSGCGSPAAVSDGGSTTLVPPLSHARTTRLHTTARGGPVHIL